MWVTPDGSSSRSSRLSVNQSANRSAVVDLMGKRAMKTLRWLYFIPAVAFAGVADVDRVWVFANIAVGVCAIPNLIAVLALSGVFFTLKNDYFEERWQYPTDGPRRLRA